MYNITNYLKTYSNVYIQVREPSLSVS